MRRLICLLLILSLLAASKTAWAQTSTPTPSLTPSPQPTYTPFPLNQIVGTLGTPTNIPALSLTPKPWYTPTSMSPGAAFNPPSLQLGSDDENEQAHGFEAISNLNVLKLGTYFAGVMVGFYGWLHVNFPQVLKALRIFGFLIYFMSVLFYLIRRFAPELASRASNWRQGEKSDKRGV